MHIQTSTNSRLKSCLLDLWLAFRNELMKRILRKDSIKFTISVVLFCSDNLLKSCADYGIQLLNYLIDKLAASHISILKSVISLLMYIQFKTKFEKSHDTSSVAITQTIAECLKQWIVRPTVIGGSFFGYSKLSKGKDELKVIKIQVKVIINMYTDLAIIIVATIY